MIHPDTQLRWVSDVIGYGLFATRDIPAGTITYVRDALEILITPEQFAVLPAPVAEQAERFSYIDENGVRVLSWDFGRHVNHCCQCNTMSTGYGFEIAIRDIAAGEEITDEYGLFNMPQPMSLSCSRGPCRGVVCAVDLDTHADAWDAQVATALSRLHDIPQPLAPLLDASTVAALDRLRDGGPPRSVRCLQASTAPPAHPGGASLPPADEPLDSEPASA